MPKRNATEIERCMAACPDYPDYPTSWAIQKELGDALEHDPECSSVPGWSPMSGPWLLCDCAAVTLEWLRIREELYGEA